ncbi:hypothetical protein JTB14_028146 [Gonioctena quinquepunctata]|nr:hypothetical protein JTB14_028146 [Gonioctena quinquepunctata]
MTADKRNATVIWPATQLRDSQLLSRAHPLPGLSRGEPHRDMHARPEAPDANSVRRRSRSEKPYPAPDTLRLPSILPMWRTSGPAAGSKEAYAERVRP